MRHHAIVALALLGLGCATSGATPSSTEHNAVQFDDGFSIRTPDRSNATIVRRSLSDTFAAIMAAYIKLGISTETRDDVHNVVGNAHIVVQHRWLGQSVSRYLSCGADAMNSPYADQYLITVSVLTTLSAVDSGTARVATAVVGSARGYDINAHVSCSSTGALERSILQTASAL